MRSLRCLSLVGSLAAAALWLAGCSSDPQEPHGSPVLLEIDWVATTGRTIIYAAGSDAATSALLPGAAGEIDFVFDRRLDGTRIEDVVGDKTQPKAIPPITVTWTGMGDAADAGTDAGVAGGFSYQVFYSSTPLASAPSAFSSYVYLRPRIPGFPSSTPVTFHLDPNGLTSAYGEPMIGPEDNKVTVMVGPMTTVLDDSSPADALPTYAPSFAFSVRFSNRLPAAADLLPFTHARADGTEVPVVLALDPQDPTRLFVAPAACLGGWPAGRTVEVTFDAGLPDAFGVPTPMALIGGRFIVAGLPPDGGAADASVDGGCGG
jgi:hypothetical protein